MKVLQRERKRAGLSLRKLSDKTGVDPSYLSKAETGRILSANQLAAVAKALGWEKDPAELFDEAEDDDAA